MLTADQIIAAHKAYLTSLHEMTSKALVTVEKIAELNLQASKATLDEHTSHAHALLSAKDIKELAKLQNNALEPLAEKAASYSRHLYEIASGLGSEFSQLAESQMADAQKQFVAAMETAVRILPHGSEPALASLQSAVSNADTAMKSVRTAIKQATDAAHGNFNAMAESAVKAVKTAKASKAS
jgi:phasin family protein